MRPCAAVRFFACWRRRRRVWRRHRIVYDGIASDQDQDRIRIGSGSDQDRIRIGSGRIGPYRASDQAVSGRIGPYRAVSGRIWNRIGPYLEPYTMVSRCYERMVG
jgi:hypothetical protein